MDHERISKGLLIDKRKEPLIVVRVRRAWLVSALLLAACAVIMWSFSPAWSIVFACFLILRLAFAAVGYLWFTEMEFDIDRKQFQAQRHTPFGKKVLVSASYSALAFVLVQGTRPRWALKAEERYIRLGDRSDVRALIARAGLHDVSGDDQFGPVGRQ
jgi:hypothetical protein